MTKLDDRLIPKVAKLVERLGKEVTFETLSPGVYNSNTRRVESSMTPVVKKATPPYPFSEHLINGDTVQYGDMKLGLPALGLTFTPQIGWNVVVDTKRYRILAVEPVYTGDRIALYTLHLRS